MPVIVLLPVVPFVHHVVSSQLDPPHVSASATTTAMDSEGVKIMDMDKSMSHRSIWGNSSSRFSLTGWDWAQPKSSPPDFPDFKYQEIPSPVPKVPRSTRSPTDGHPRCPYRDKAESNGSSASMHNPKNQSQYKEYGDGSHVSNSPSSRARTSSCCRTTHFEHKSLTPQPHYEGKRKASGGYLNATALAPDLGWQQVGKPVPHVQLPTTTFGKDTWWTSSCSDGTIASRKFPTVPSQLQPLLIVDKVPEALSFTHCVLSKPTQGLEKETKKEMQQMQQDKREASKLPQLSMDVDNQKLSSSSLPLKGIMSLVNGILHPVLKCQSNQSQAEGGRA
ncbi:hypothetical protein BU17DRAFT_68774 [Hysterangium stoloniferum]|nr:hypothetical protein BU17DRAFT_68774 [Hysterangium stoloniferum]